MKTAVQIASWKKSGQITAVPPPPPILQISYFGGPLAYCTCSRDNYGGEILGAWYCQEL